MGWFEERAGLDGTVAVVTGGANETGRAIALRLANEGAIVVIADVDAERGHATVDAVVAALGSVPDPAWGRA